jgi:large subunit ribosomal protein L18
MNKIELIKKRRIRRKRIIRKRIYGTGAIPRVSVYKSNKYLYVQVIDDDKGVTITSASSFNLDKNARKLNKSTAKKVGELLAKKLQENKIDKIVFDRNGFLFTGRIKALADGARSAGIKF